MPYTLWSSIERFRAEIVDLDPNETGKARISRNFLFDQLKTLDVRNEYVFPKLYKNPIPYGSFARKTKIRPLDDIDLLLLLDGKGTTATGPHVDGSIFFLRIDDYYSPLEPYKDDTEACSLFYGYVDSVKVLNSIKSSLSKIGYYKKAEIRRNQQAVVLNLTSYDWSFDIVPAVPVTDYNGDVSHYVIPDGTGNWMRTDPRRDSARITAINQKHCISVHAVVRLLKMWNRRTNNKPRLESYYFETLCLNVFEYASGITSIPKAIEYFFLMCPSHIWRRCPDPKGLGDDLDVHVNSEMKTKVVNAMNEAYCFAATANRFDTDSKHRDAINEYRRLFGEEFPAYG